MTTKNKNIIHIDSGSWLADIAVGVGANLFRLYHKASGIDLLRSPKSSDELRVKPQLYGIPVLFPPNRIADGKFIFKGLEYNFPVNEPERGNHLHGLVLGAPWRLVELQDYEITMQLEFSALAGFPHDFTLTLNYHSWKH